MTAVEWEHREQIGKIEETLLASGRTIEDINAEWETKSAEQIIKEYSGQPEPRKVGKALPLPVETDWFCASFVDFVTTPPPQMWFHVHLTLRGGMAQEYDQEALTVDCDLLELLETLQAGEQIEVRLRMHFGKKVPCTLMDVRKQQPKSEHLLSVRCVRQEQEAN